MAKTETAGASEQPEKLVEVRLLRKYVPVDAEFESFTEQNKQGDTLNTKVYIPRWPGEILSLPREEARMVIRAGIAEITADLV